MSFQFSEAFPRAQMKSDAREALRGHWLAAICIMLLYSVFSYLGTYAMMKMMLPGVSLTEFILGSGKLMEQVIEQGPAWASNPQTLAFLGLVGLIVGVLLSGIFQMALVMWASAVGERRSDETTLGAFFGFFSYGLTGALMFLWMNLWLLVWTLPFTLALGIIGMVAGGNDTIATMAMLVIMLAMMVVIIWKSIQYSMAFYALAQDPDIGARRALRLSIERTAGHIWDLFVMYLSFIGWLILTSLLPPVQIYVMPYMAVSFVNAWRFLRPGGIDAGRTGLSVAPEDASDQPASAPDMPEADPLGLPSEPAPQDRQEEDK